MRICYLYYSHVCFIPLSSFYRLTHLHFDILSIANSDEIGDLVFNHSPCILSKKDLHFWICRQNATYIFCTARGRGSEREKPNYGAFFQCQRARTSVSLCRFGTFAKLCLPQPCHVSKLFPPSCCSCVLCEMRNSGGVSPAALHRGLHMLFAMEKNIYKMSVWSDFAQVIEVNGCCDKSQNIFLTVWNEITIPYIWPAALLHVRESSFPVVFSPLLFPPPPPQLRCPFSSDRRRWRLAWTSVCPAAPPAVKWLHSSARSAPHKRAHRGQQF